MALIQAFGRSLWVQSQPDLHSKLQIIQGSKNKLSQILVIALKFLKKGFLRKIAWDSLRWELKEGLAIIFYITHVIFSLEVIFI